MQERNRLGQELAHLALREIDAYSMQDGAGVDESMGSAVGFGRDYETPQQVWDVSPRIHNHFNNSVNRFTQTTLTQFNSAPSVRFHFTGIDDGDLPYRAIYPKYFNLGIDNPAQWIRDNIRDVQFFGRGTTVHQQMVTPLTNVRTAMQADAALTALGANRGVVNIGGFVPRQIRGSNVLSHHSLGRAVDLNSNNNLRFRDFFRRNAAANVTKLLGIIKLVTGVDLNAVTNYATQKRASDDFRTGFAGWKRNQKTWLNDFLKTHRAAMQASLAEYQNNLKVYKGGEEGKQEIKNMIANQKELVKGADDAVKEQEKVLRNVDSVRAAISTLTARGFLNLPAQIVAHFRAAGFVWGGEWSGVDKDYMHFQRGGLTP